MDNIIVEPSILKPKLMPALERAIEEGVKYGYNRAFKHEDNPTEQHITDTIQDAVMQSIHEWFDLV